MDFDIGTIIYIIITIVAIVAGARGKKRKQTQKPAGAAKEESKVEGFLNKLGVQLEGMVDETKQSVNTFTEELIPGESKAEPAFEAEGGAYDHIVDEVLETNKPYADFEGEYDPDSFDNLDLITSEAKRSTSDPGIGDIIELDDISNSDYSELVKEFDLQTAVIYSAILNKVEY